jgi:hypothetical protein
MSNQVSNPFVFFVGRKIYFGKSEVINLLFVFLIFFVASFPDEAEADRSEYLMGSHPLKLLERSDGGSV